MRSPNVGMSVLLAAALLMASCSSPGQSAVSTRQDSEPLERVTGDRAVAPVSERSQPHERSESEARHVGSGPSGAPRLELDGQDYARMVRSHYAFRDWLFENPDPARVGALMHPSCTCFEDDRVLLEDYKTRGLRWLGGDLEVLAVDVIDDQAENMVHLRVVVRRATPGELVDATGQVHDRLEPIGPHAWEEVYVRREPGEPWRLRVADELGPVTASPEGDDA